MSSVLRAFFAEICKFMTTVQKSFFFIVFTKPVIVSGKECG